MTTTKDRSKERLAHRRPAHSSGVPRMLLAATLAAGSLGLFFAGRLAHVLRSVRISYDDTPPANGTGPHLPNEDQVAGTWLEIRGKVKQRWGALTDDEIAKGEGKLEELAGTIQKNYGGAKADVLAQLRKL